MDEIWEILKTFSMWKFKEIIWIICKSSYLWRVSTKIVTKTKYDCVWKCKISSKKTHLNIKNNKDLDYQDIIIWWITLQKESIKYFVTHLMLFRRENENTEGKTVYLGVNNELYRLHFTDDYSVNGLIERMKLVSKTTLFACKYCM